jgi:hypothetical protein
LGLKTQSFANKFNRLIETIYFFASLGAAFFFAGAFFAAGFLGAAAFFGEAFFARAAFLTAAFWQLVSLSFRSISWPLAS